VRLLLSNDDGHRAPGLRCLAEALGAVAEITVVAPDRDRSGASNSLTLDRPVHARLDEWGFTYVNGTPTDCVHLAITGLLEYEPDMVISGINAGANMGDDVHYSGTVAAAMEGTALEIPSIALSQSFAERDDPEEHWDCAERHAPGLVKKLFEIGWPKGVLLNINFPDQPAEEVSRVRVTQQGTRDQSQLRVDQRVDARGQTYFWIGFRRIFTNPDAGSDLRAISEGEISVTPLHLNLTEMGEHERLSHLLDGDLSRLD
jgi:5'-nucleotidase